ncbi:MAG TPA: phosphopyruvate hydratase [bacterium]|nr:MAG: Enolase [Parcubacteria group bacterium ADurb.Bin192]HPN14508.1 phosphopyruvate hydratase [bacterium]
MTTKNDYLIQSIVAREVLDSRGNPTVACRVTLKSGASAEAKVPSGASTGSHEALELRDGGKRYGGKGVLKAVVNINKKVAPILKNIDVRRQKDIDHVMIELDGTSGKKKLGANAILAVSLACAQVHAVQAKKPLWQIIRKIYNFPRPAGLPVPTMNVLNGGAHANWSLDVQECMIVPLARKMSDRVRMGAEVFQALKKILAEKDFATTVGDEGGFAPKLKTVEAAFDLLKEAIKAAGYKPGKDVALATDVAASEFYDSSKAVYVFRAEGGREFTSDKLLDRYLAWQKKYPLVSIEDPFAEDDWAAWSGSFSRLSKRSHIVGDDLLVTNIARLDKAVAEKTCNAILIKVNQIGTLTEAVSAIIMAHKNGFATSISHRSGETDDTTIADLAVASGSEYIKTGSLSRSERVEKYNRLLEIEENEM